MALPSNARKIEVGGKTYRWTVGKPQGPEQAVANVCIEDPGGKVHTFRSLLRMGDVEEGTDWKVAITPGRVRELILRERI